MPPRTRATRRTLAVAAFAAPMTIVGSSVAMAVAPVTADAASGSPADHPVDIVAGQTTSIVVPADDGGVVAFTGAGRQSRPVAYADADAAEAAGLTTFRAVSSSNGLFRLVSEGTAQCLDVDFAAPDRYGVLLTDVGCDVPSGLWDVDGGVLTDADGLSVGGGLTDVGGRPAVSVVDGAGGAQTSVALDRQAAPEALADIDITVGTGPSDRAVASGTAPVGTEVIVSDLRGAERGRAVTDAAGRWSTGLGPVDSNGGPAPVVVSAYRAVTELVARGSAVIPYGDPISIPAEPVRVADDGTVAVSGSGAAGGVVSVRSGGTADPVEVGADGSWALRVTTSAERSAADIVLEQRAPGGDVSRLLVEARASELDASVVFPTDPDEPAYVEGDGTPESTYVVLDAGTEVGSAVADATGHYEVELEAPGAGGVHEYTVEERVGAQTLATATLSADYGAAVAITAPADGDDVQGDLRVTGTGEPGAEVTVEVGGREVNALVGDDGTWEASTAPVTDAPFAIVLGADATYTSRSRPVWIGTGTPGATVRLSLIGDGAGTSGRSVDRVVRPDGTWRIDADDLTLDDGSDHRVDLVLTGDSGGQERLTTDLRFDRRPVTLTTVADGGTIAPVDGRVTLEGRGTPGDLITMVLDGVARPRAVTVRADGTWTMRDQVITVGSHVARFVGVHGTSGDLRFTVESDAAALTVTSPAPGDVVDAGVGGVLVTGRAEPGKLGGVELRPGQLRSFVADDLGRWSVRVPAPDGPATLRAFALGAAPVEFPVTVRSTPQGG